MKINGQYYDINIGPIYGLIFKYQELTRKFQNYFQYSSILIGKIFHYDI
jgi:hypothetical protein